MFILVFYIFHHLVSGFNLFLEFIFSFYSLMSQLLLKGLDGARVRQSCFFHVFNVVLAQIDSELQFLVVLLNINYILVIMLTQMLFLPLKIGFK